MMKLLFVFSLASAALADIPVDSKLGHRLLSKARLLNDNNNAYTWVSNYSIKFHSCHTTLEFRADGGSGDGQQDEEPTESMRLVHFTLCPTDSCHAGCHNGADYLVEMREFVESYLEFQMDQQEYNCEQVKENCYCDNYNDDEVCLSQCYATAGLDYCDEQDNDDEFEIDRFLECEALNEDNNNNNNNYYYQQSVTYVGAYCASNGRGIHLGTFSDRQCTKHTSTSNYKKYTGYDLPYTTTSIVSNDCISCQEPSEYDDDYNQDQYDADEVREICEGLYERSAKCEKNIPSSVNPYKSTGGCDYIFNTLPKVERLSKGGPVLSTVFAWVFFSSTVLVSAYAAFLWQKAKRAHVDLSLSSGGGNMA